MAWFPSILDLTALPKEKINGVSKYKPHQGKREKLRRRIGGFARYQRDAAAETRRKAGISKTQ
ncbi:MAG TPA: hypothetical protein VMX14_09920 [Anaerolineae bacterium]|nr:hypothetical protein [Anaerolineae bacterium]